MSDVVKNRYFELDGTPVESKAWRRYVSPWTLAAAFSGALVLCALPEEDTKTTPAGAFSGAVVGLAATGYMRKRQMKTYRELGLQDYVIDSQPETSRHTCTQNQLSSMLDQRKVSAAATLTGYSMVGGYCGLTKPFYQALAITLPVLPAPLANACENYYIAHKIENEEWIIIKRGEMQEQEAPSHVQGKSFSFAHK